MRQHLLSSRNWQKAKQKLSANFGQLESSDRANSITRTITQGAMMMKLKGASQGFIEIFGDIFFGKILLDFLKLSEIFVDRLLGGFLKIFAEILLKGFLKIFAEIQFDGFLKEYFQKY